MILLPLVFATFLAVETSPFGTLTDETTQNREVLEVRDLDVADYRGLLEEYKTLTRDSANAFGAQRTTLQEQALARAKDVLLAKLGATENHIQNLIDRLAGTDKEVLVLELQKLQTYITDAKAGVEAATTLAELRTISLEINTKLRGIFGVGNYYALRIWIQRGLGLIGLLMDKADLIQAHIDGSAELGGDTADIQAKFDAAMLSLENAKLEYETASTALEGLPANDPGVLSQLQKVRATNAIVVQAHADLKQVVKDLRALYGQSPWEINLTEEM